VIFTDFYSALEEIPEIVEQYFGTALPFDEDKLTATIPLTLTQQQFYTCQITLK
jgi:Fe-S cluster assembly scaffold protein SufB